MEKSILIAEDNEADQTILKQAFSMLETEHGDLTFANDGQEVLDLLEAAPKLPSLIILDLNMPRKNGKEVIREIKSKNHLKHLPVLILTSSMSDSDIKECYALNANSYLIKPPSFSGLLTLVKAIDDYWLCHVLYPNN